MIYLLTVNYNCAELIKRLIASFNDDLSATLIIVNNFVLFANHPQVIKAAINNLQAPDLNLVSSLEYQKASQQIPKNSLAVTFFNLPEISKWQKLELAESTYHSQILSLALNSQGLLAESTFLTNSQIVPPSLPLSQPVAALQYIKLDRWNMDYNTVTENITRLTDDLNT